MKYRPDIDGLRALAIMPVVMFHAGFSCVPGGYIGVDVFFVISGYVIALSLLEDLQNGSYSLYRFYAKRIRRIFPALFVTIAATSILSWCILLPSHLHKYFESVIAAVLFVSNIFFWKTSGYFASGAMTQPLLHTWSLSVEEQFYLFIPSMMALIWRHLPGKWPQAILPAIILSLGASIYATNTAPTANFFVLPTRAWELLIGVFLGTISLPEIRNRSFREAIGLISLLLITCPVFMYDDSTPFPGINALSPCLGTAMLIYLGRGSPTYTSTLLMARPLVFVGLISYSLYLVHWPIAAFYYYMTASQPTPLISAAIVSASIVLAYFSWRYVETPTRAFSLPQCQSKILVAGAAAMAVCAGISGMALFGKGFQSRFPDFVEQTIPGHDLWQDGTCFLSNNPDVAHWSAAQCTLSHNGMHRVLLWGDSFAAQYVPGIIDNQRDFDATIVQYTAAGCPPILSYYSYARPKCTDFNRNALKVIDDNKIDAVILSARWSDLKGRGLAQLATTLSEMDKRHIQVYLLGQSPEFLADVQILSYHKLGESPDGSKQWALSFSPALNDTLAHYSGSASFIDPLKYLCNGTRCTYFAHNSYLFEDYGHLSRIGSGQAVRAFFPFLKNAQ